MSNDIIKLITSIREVKDIVLHDDVRDLKIELARDKEATREIQWLDEFITSKGKYFKLNNYLNKDTDRVLIDNEMIDIVLHLNRIGLETYSSCSGHMKSKPYVAVKGFYSLPINEKVIVKYLPLSRCTAIYFGASSDSSLMYLHNLIQFTNYITELELQDFKILDLHNVDFSNTKVSKFTKYVLNMSDEKPLGLSTSDAMSYIKILEESYLNEINISRLNEFKTNKKMKLFGE